MTKTVALVGGTGNLGGLIADALLEVPDVRVRLLVRAGSAEKASALVERGAQVVTGDLSGGDPGDPAGAGGEALAELCDGAAAVVPAVQGGPGEIVEGQRRLLAAARAAGVGRFLPSDSSVDLFGLDEGENINSDWRRAFARAAEDERGDVDVVHVLNGCFLDRQVLFGFLGAVDLQRGVVDLWGDGDQPMDFTTCADTARCTAAAATDEAAVPTRFGVAGDVLDVHGLITAYEEGSGRTLSTERHGSLDDLDALIAQRRAADPSNVFGHLPLVHWRGMLTGKGKIDPLVDDRYPGIEPTTVAQHVAAEGW